MKLIVKKKKKKDFSNVLEEKLRKVCCPVPHCFVKIILPDKYISPSIKIFDE